MPEPPEKEEANPFTHKAYRNWFWGGSLQALSQGLTLTVTLVLLAVTQSPSLAGIVLALYSLFEIASSTLGGYFADISPRKKIIIYSSLGNVIINSFLTIVLVLWGIGIADSQLTLWILIPALLLSASIYGLSDPAFDGALKSLITAEQFPRAVSATQIRSSTISIIGNPLAGLLFSLCTALPFLTKSLLEVFFLIFISKIKEDFGPRLREPIKTGKFILRIKENYRDALKFVKTEPVIGRILICAPALNLLVFGTTSWTVLTLNQAGAPSLLIGFVTSGFALGAIVGGLLTPWLTDRFPAGRLALAGLGSMIFLYGLYFFLAPSPYIMMLCAAFCMLPSPPLNAGLFSHVYKATPVNLQGRVHALFTTIGGLGAVLGPAWAGLSISLGHAAWFTVPVLGIALLGYLALCLSPALRQLT